MVHAEFQHKLPVHERQRPWRNLLGWFITLNFICICWILFRAHDFSTAALLAERYLLLAPGGPQRLPYWLALVPPLLLGGQWLMRRFTVETHAVRLRLPWFGLPYDCVWALVISLLPFGYRPFIYFQF